jgi:succinate dehydrogenase / fumarate reductase, cytochrome b subunit
MLLQLASSSIGKKLLVAITGLVLVGFILGHLLGNLLIFLGPAAINEYGHMLHTMGHGMAVWVARAVILGSILLHVVLTIQLTRQNRAARSQRYGFEATQVASRSSRMMIVSGLTLLLFFVYHILHFTVRVGTDYNSLRYDLNGVDVHNVYQMVINGFSVPAISLFYIIAMLFLCSHLSHGVASIPQTFGITRESTDALFKKLGYAFAGLILVGNCSIPIAIWLFGYGR